MVQHIEEFSMSRVYTPGLTGLVSSPYGEPIPPALIRVGLAKNRRWIEERKREIEEEAVNKDVSSFLSEKDFLRALYYQLMDENPKFKLEQAFRDPDKKVLKWEGRLGTFDQVQGLFAFFQHHGMRNIASDPALQYEVRQRFEEIIQNSPTFSDLTKTESITPGNNDSPEQHMLQQLDKSWCQLEKIPEENRDLYIHMCFWHDFGKVNNARHPMHGTGSALIARSFYEMRNATARLHKLSVPYAEAFIDDVCFLIENHHFFQDIHRFMNPEVEQFIKRADKILRDEVDVAKHKVISSPLRRLVYKYISKGKRSIISRERFEKAFPQLIHRPDMLQILLCFCRADLLTNKKYAKNYYIENELLFEELMGYIAPQWMLATQEAEVPEEILPNSIFRSTTSQPDEMLRERTLH